ncbi:MAG: hypothetical protein FD142_3214, partial [bacterium]
ELSVHATEGIVVLELEVALVLEVALGVEGCVGFNNQPVSLDEGMWEGRVIWTGEVAPVVLVGSMPRNSGCCSSSDSCDAKESSSRTLSVGVRRVVAVAATELLPLAVDVDGAVEMLGRAC